MHGFIEVSNAFEEKPLPGPAALDTQRVEAEALVWYQLFTVQQMMCRL
jgi:hypothetical protein